MMNHYLFSYGTLQLEKVQLESFGRKLKGQHDVLTGHLLGTIEIRDPNVLARSEKQFHPIARYTGKPEDRIEGVLFEVSEEELKQADAYEVSDYKRVRATFQSGKQGWVYVSV